LKENWKVEKSRRKFNKEKLEQNLMTILFLVKKMNQLVKDDGNHSNHQKQKFCHQKVLSLIGNNFFKLLSEMRSIVADLKRFDSQNRKL
jgi:hypothetical protein